MATHTFSSSALIEARPEVVYGIIADYKDGHPHILPRPPFVSLDVIEGGVGAGTKIHVKMKVLGKDGSFNSDISEPEPGRVLVETNDNGYVSTFTVEPRADGKHAFVTIATTMERRKGPLGALECWFISRTMLPVYKREIAQLAELAKKRS